MSSLLRFVFLSSLLLVPCLHVSAQQPDEPGEPVEQTAPTSAPGPEERAKTTEKSKEPKEKEKEKPPVVTHHEIRSGGKALKYTATVGLMPVKNADGDTEAHIFFMAYTLENAPAGAHRPLTFCFNGGPGSSSVWLHMGAIGPRRVRLQSNGGMPRPPFDLEDNQETWLDRTDLVFIDPVGTGYSRPAKKELGKKFWGVKGDIESVGQFIRLYLTRYERWTSPLFLAGESYGTTRAAGLSGYLIDNGIALNGIVLVSTVLNFETLDFAKGNDLPYVLFLPSYTATAWYHKKLPPDLQEQDLPKILPEVEQWAANDYALALAKGDRLTSAERGAVAARLARYSGLSTAYILRDNLRVKQWEFCKELLRDENRSVGRLDSRFKGIDESGVSEEPDYDPSLAIIRPPFTSVFNQYVRAELNYQTDEIYYILGGGFSSTQWDWGSAIQGFPNLSPDLRSAFVKNPYMKLFVAEGYFDLATPFFAVDYTLEHLGLDTSLRGNIATGQFNAGHMVYIDSQSLDNLKHNVAAFMDSATK
jgi:carboxypeptidase C (cathepsin A)